MRLFVRCPKIKSGGFRPMECCKRDQANPQVRCPKNCENREGKENVETNRKESRPTML